MAAPRLRLAVLGAAIALDFVLLIALCTSLLLHGKRTVDRPAPAPPAGNDRTPKPGPTVTGTVVRQPRTIWFRIVDLTNKKPVPLARIEIQNLNFADELGADSSAIAWRDGRAMLTHRFLMLVERRAGRESARFSFQGPWLTISAHGYIRHHAPLSEVLGNEQRQFGPDVEVVVALRPGQAEGHDLAGLAGDYRFGDGFVNFGLNVNMTGKYKYFYRSDVVRPDDPHDAERFQSTGICRVLDDVLRLTPEGPVSSDLEQYMRNDFVPVEWADRRYLVPANWLADFCNVVNKGGVPRSMRDGPFEMPAGGLVRPVGLPLVPREWAPFLLEKPVTGTITDVLSDQLAFMSAGAQGGVRAGMEFARENRLEPRVVKVLFADADRCLVRARMPTDHIVPGLEPAATFVEGPFYRPQPLALGEKLSTQSADPDSDF